MKPALTWRRVCGAVVVLAGAALLGWGTWQHSAWLSILGVACWVAAVLGLGILILKRINAVKHLSASNHLAAGESARGGAKKNMVNRPTVSSAPTRTPVYAGMATIPSRVATLERTVTSIYDQVDRLFIYLNNYDQIPDFLRRDKIDVFTSQDLGDVKDSGKFYGLTRVQNGIYLSLDDDIEYPPDYARVMKNALARFNNKCVVGVHGIFFPTLVHSFFDRKYIHFAKRWDVTVPVSMLGTGTTAFSIEESGITFEMFKHHGMADISLALFLKKRQLPALVIRRDAGWLRSLSDEENLTLYGSTQRDSTQQTEAIVAARPWGLSELCTRVERASISSLLPARWHTIVAAYREGEKAAELVNQYPLGALIALIRTLMTDCEAWNVVNIYEPRRSRDVQLHCNLLKGCLKVYPEQVLDFCREKYRTARERLAREVMTPYAGVYIAGLCKLSMYEEADELYRDLEAQNAISADVVMEYVRLKAQEGDHQRVISLAREHYVELNQHGDFVPVVYGAIAQVEGVQAAVHGFMPSFFQQGRPAARRRRTIIAACKQARAVGLGDALAFDFASAETAATKRDILCVLDLILFYVVLGEKERARSLLETNSGLVDERCGPAFCALMFAVTASNHRDSLAYINRYNECHDLAPIEISIAAGDQESFLSCIGTSGSVEPATDRGKISVVIAAFNAAKTIGYAVRSVLAQSYRNLEVIVVDDASTDGTWEELEALRRSDDRVNAIRKHVNAGPYVCRNVALKVSNGAYVAIHDADDFAHPQRIERQIEAFDRKDVVAVFARHIRLDRDGLIALENNGEIIGHGPVTLVCRRSVFEGIGEFMPVRTRGDIEFRDRMRCYYGSHRLAQLEDVLVYALHDPGSNSHVMVAAPEARRKLELFRAEYNRRLMLRRSIDELRVQTDCNGVLVQANHRTSEGVPC